ncbi:MAG: hypothetical protein HY289_12795 [Planctomycetes bacterium]|nr:hypothetical protein [Planctomycetota bacterium]
MIVVWLGWGPLALVVLFPPLLLVSFLIGYNPMIAIVAAAASLLLGGILCWFLGRKLNRGSGYHTLYFIPLEKWGVIFILLGVNALGCLAVLFLAAGVFWILKASRAM